MPYLWSILITVNNRICFGCVKETSPRDWETFLLPAQNFCFIEKKLIITYGGYIFYVYLPTIRTTDKLERKPLVQ